MGAPHPPTIPWYWEKPSGKGKSKDKGKGKGAKSKSFDWPSHWAFKNPKGVSFCRNYFLKNQDLKAGNDTRRKDQKKVETTHEGRT